MDTKQWRHSPWVAPLLVAAVTVIGVLVAWGSVIGPQQVFTGPGPQPSMVTTTPTEEQSFDAEREELQEALTEHGNPPTWLKWVVWIFDFAVLAAIAFVMWLGLRAAKNAWDRRRPRSDLRRDQADLDPISPDGRDRTIVESSAEQAMRVLSQGSPRNGIVALWDALEQQAAAGGVRREEWQTSSEFVIALLDRAGASHGEVVALGELYREARFSEHELAEGDRDRARELFEASIASLRVGR